jgi:hypothetical protein
MIRRWLSVLALGLVTTFASGAFADGWVNAGSALRTKSIAFVNIKVYTITSLIREKPKERSKGGMINADVDKQLLLYMQRDVPTDKMKTAFRDAFKMNGYGDGAKIEQFVGALGSGDVDEWKSEKGKPQPPPSVAIVYNAKSQTTTMTVAGHGSTSIGGVDFMKAVWSIWYGKIDQPAMGDQLMANLPKD